MQAAIPLATNVSQVTAEPRDDSGACREQTQELRDEIVRDVRTAWLGAAQTRYKLGLRSIVELSQAQLQQTEAEIKKERFVSVSSGFGHTASCDSGPALR